mgnify:FL=1
MMIQQIPQRLQEVNTLLATFKQDSITFEQAMLLSLFYKDFNETNQIVTEAAAMFQDDAEQLNEIFFSLFSEAEKFLSLDNSGLQSVDFEGIFNDHLKPYEAKYEEAKDVSTGLWCEYSAMSNRLDFLPLDSEDYKSLDPLCDAKKVEYDTAHARVNLLYNELQQERDRTFCVYCFKPMFLSVLVERLKGISGSIISDIRRMKEDAHE